MAEMTEREALETLEKRVRCYETPLEKCKTGCVGCDYRVGEELNDAIKVAAEVLRERVSG